MKASWQSFFIRSQMIIYGIVGIISPIIGLFSVLGIEGFRLATDDPFHILLTSSLSLTLVSISALAFSMARLRVSLLLGCIAVTSSIVLIFSKELSLSSNVDVSLLLLGMSLVMVARPTRSNFSFWAAALAVSLACAFELVTILSGILDLIPKHENYKQLLYINIIILILGLLFFIQISSLTVLENNRKKIIFPCVVFSSLILATALLWLAVERRDQLQIQSNTAFEARATEQQLRLALEDRTSALQRMAQRWTAENGTPKHLWEQDARALLQHIPGIRAIGWVSNDRQLKWVEPEMVRSKIKNFDLRTDLYRGRAMDEAQLRNGVSIFQGLTLSSNEPGLVAFAPVKKRGGNDGFISMGFKIQDFTEAVLPKSASNIKILSNDRPLIELIRGNGLKHASAESAFSWRGLNWRIVVTATSQSIPQAQRFLPWIVLVVGLLFSSLVSGLIWAFYSIRIAHKLERQTTIWKKAVLGASQMAIVSVNESGIIKSFNPYAEKLTGYSAQDVIGIHRPDIWHDAEEVAEYGKQLNSEYGINLTTTAKILTWKAIRGEAERRRWTFVRKDGGRRQVSLTISAVTDQKGIIIGFVGIAEDITLQRAQQQEIELQRVRILAASKMSSLGEMAAGIGHEINNPLAIIKGTVEQLTRAIEDSKDVQTATRNYLTVLDHTVDRIAAIVRGLKTFARDGSRDPFVPTRVGDLVDDMLSMCASRIHQNQIELNCRHIDRNAQLFCRPAQICQVVINLISNAADAAMSSDLKWIEVRTGVENDEVWISVADSGAGVPEDIREKIMEPFFTTKEVGRSTGLGLSISQNIVTDHGGTLRLETDAPHTTFIVRVPVAQESKDRRIRRNLKRQHGQDTLMTLISSDTRPKQRSQRGAGHLPRS